MNKLRVQKCLVSSGLLTIALFIFFASVDAQSGRRIKTPVPAPTPVPEATPTPVPSPTPETTEPQYSFKVLRNFQFTSFGQILAPDNIQRRVVERLRTSPLLGVQSGGESNRKEAIDLAKESEETYFILLTLSEEQLATPERDSITGKIRTSRFWVHFDIFAPRTGKSAGSGTTFLDFNKRAGILTKTRQQRCYPNVYGEELALLEAGYEIAERIMAKFNIPVRSTCK